MKLKRYLAVILTLCMMLSITQLPVSAQQKFTLDSPISVSTYVAPKFSLSTQSTATDEEGYTTYNVSLPTNPTFAPSEYYANELNDYQKAMYRAFMDGICSIEADDLTLKQKISVAYSVEIPANVTTNEQFNAIIEDEFYADWENFQGGAIYNAIQYDHTELFWVQGVRYQLYVEYADYSNGVVTIYLVAELLVDASDLYTSDATLVFAAKSMNNTVDSILAATPTTSEYSAVKYFNDWLKQNNTYNHPHLENRNYPLAHSCISAFLSNNVEAVGPVCQGYAYALKYLCDKMGIDSVIVTGDLYQAYAEPGPHAWNAIELDGNWYAVDVTSNDSLGTDRYNFLVGSGTASHDPMYRTFGTSHVIDDNHVYPTLSSTAYQYVNPCKHIYDNDCDADCNECGEKRTVTHKYDNGCDTDCNVCGATRTTTHKYDNACDVDCNNCGEKRTVGDHVYDNDCDADCNICGEKRSASHIYDNNCDHSCNKCGEIRAITHTYDDDDDMICNVCGQERVFETPATSFVYEIVNEQVKINGFIGSETEVVIPSAIEGYPVTKIGNYAFDNSKFVSVKLPNSVETIGEQAFAWCESLKSIDFGKGLKVIGTDAFNGCRVLENVTFPDGLENIEYAAFISCVMLTHVVIPDSVTKLGKLAFMHCTSLETIVIGSGVTTIPNNLLYNCPALKSVTFTNSVKTIESSAVTNSSLFTDIHFIGSKEDKNSIEIDPLWNEIIINAEWHYFDSVCDTTCSECDVTREAQDHTYDDDKDDTCNVCEEKRVIVAVIPGDVNGDGNVNNKDLGVLRRYLNDWDVEIDMDAADVNDDGAVNNKDLGILRRYLNDWDVVLK